MIGQVTTNRKRGAPFPTYVVTPVECLREPAFDCVQPLGGAARALLVKSCYFYLNFVPAHLFQPMEGRYGCPCCISRLSFSPSPCTDADSLSTLTPGCSLS
ncbi:unnamed protein product, partial [Scytosiphon promiscuus]